MTVADVLLKANRGGIAGPDMDLESVLFDQILPEFLFDVGSTSWIVRRVTATIAAGERTFDVPADCDRIEMVRITDGKDPIPYIGEDEMRVSAAEAATTPSNTPTGWYYVDGDNGEANGKVKFSNPFLSNATVYYSYRRRVPRADTVDLAFYLPVKFHYALVEGVRREIYLDRYGDGDSRITIQAGKFEEWKDRARDDRESAPAGHYVVRMN